MGNVTFFKKNRKTVKENTKDVSVSISGFIPDSIPTSRYFIEFPSEFEIPHYLVKILSPFRCEMNFGTFRWYDIELSIDEQISNPIQLKIGDLIYNPNKLQIKIIKVNPVGDVINQWMIYGYIKEFYHLIDESNESKMVLCVDNITNI